MVDIKFKWLLCSCFFVLTALRPAPSTTKPEENHEAGKHPFYISVTEINHNASEKSLEISCKIFTDDMEAVLKKNDGSAVDLAAEKAKTRNDVLIEGYIKKHLSISADGKPAPLQYVGFEKEKEAVYCYFEVLNVASPKKIQISNSLLHDFFAEQINIMHLTVNGKRQSTKLNYPEKDAAFVF